MGFGRRGRAATESEVVPPVLEVASETEVSLAAVKVPAARIVGKKRTYDVAPLVEGRRVGTSFFCSRPQGTDGCVGTRIVVPHG